VPFPIAAPPLPVTASEPTDADLLARARDGASWAFRRLVERYQDQVAATVVGMLGPGAEADDVGQETFIRFYEAMDQFRGDAELGTYLTRIAINQSLKALNRRKRWYERFWSRDGAPDDALPPEPSTEGDDAIDEDERSALVHRALAELSDAHRAVVVLRMLKGYSTRETAEILDIPEGTVMSRLYRATSNLETLLGPYISADDLSP
jgi:RNA polymerase sigma-70 factor (ECF subfamily)